MNFYSEIAAKNLTLKNKPCVLFFPFPLLSHYLRCIILAQSIKNDFDVRFPAVKDYQEILESAGFQDFACETFDTKKVMQSVKNFNFSWLNLKDLEGILNSQVATIEKYRPMWVLGDVAPTLKIACEITKTPYVTLTNGYMSKYYSDIRKIAVSHPAHYLSSRIPKNIFKHLTSIGENLAFRRIHQPFQALRKKYALAKRKIYLDELEGDLNLICDLEELFPQRILPENYHIIGPLYYQDSQAELEILEKIQADKATILISMGSSGDWTQLRFFEDKRFSCFNIIAAGDSGGILNAPHIIKKDFVNNVAILKHANLMVCHGGNGSIYQALSCGIPLLCFSNIFEQEWNIDRIQAMGLGESIVGVKHPAEVFRVCQNWICAKGTGKFIEIAKKINLNQTKLTFRTLVSQHFSNIINATNL